MCCARRGPDLHSAARACAALGALAVLLTAGCGGGQAPEPGPDTTAADAPAPDSPEAAAPDDGMRLVGSVTVPEGMRFQGTTVGGLSGIDYDPATGRYVVISDDRGAHGPTRAYTLDLPLGPDGRPGQPRFLSMIPLAGPDGPYAPGTSDTESIRWAPDGGVVYGSEGDATGALTPFIRSAEPDGTLRRDYPLPPYYLPASGPDGDQVRGMRENLGFEGLALAPDGRTISAITENALVQDGPAAAAETPSPSRLLQLDRATGAVTGEYVYEADPLRTTGTAIGPAVAGVSAMTQVGPAAFLTVERSLALPRGFVTSIYLTTTDGATDVAGADALTGGETAMHKTKLFETEGLMGNVEGITLGPDLPDGARTLVLVEDDNFGRVGSTTFHVVRVGSPTGF
ncbi:esterase-like activity of phytase family protein [Tomitella cavernea]|uniref:Esterase-like activity of phytase family protein n=1 Tax=Tomitella cavernea TaxID=1387982 RepID=A0ABP9C653_9ACTN|nr:esterase-like activity of phytase family protein [Tomitella cavernea]